MEGIGELVEDFLRRRPLPEARVANAVTPGVSGVPGIAPNQTTWFQHRAGYADQESYYAAALTTIDLADADWTNLANAAGSPNGSLASSSAFEGSLTEKVLESAALLFAPPSPATLVGFTADVTARSPAVASTLFARLYDGSDVALGTAKSVSLTASLTTHTLGGSADLWGTGMTAQQLRDSGVKLAVWASVDDLFETGVFLDAQRLTAHYTYDA